MVKKTDLNLIEIFQGKRRPLCMNHRSMALSSSSRLTSREGCGVGDAVSSGV